MTMINTSSKTAQSSLSHTRRPTLRRILSVWRSRRALAKLDADGLRDVGLSKSQAQREANRAPWDVPDTWVNR